jgi:hypothetical protein
MLSFVSVRPLKVAQLIFHLFTYLNVPVTRPRLFKPLFALLVGASAVVACSVDHANMAQPACVGLNCGQPDPPAPSQTVPSSLADTPDAAPVLDSPAKAACGLGTCLPDDALACEGYSLPSGPARPPPVADAGVNADAGLDAGTAEQPDSSVGSFEQPTRPDATPNQFSCQLSVGRGDAIVRSCGAAGQQQQEDACTSSLDCAAGLGCVGTAGSGRCLPYCCGIGPDTCPKDFYCAERPLRDATLGETPGPMVPVCDRADRCSLGEPLDCAGQRCVCGPDTACTLVRPDGTTACVLLPPDPGQAGQKCPCDRGYHCSQATVPATCVKTCELDEKDSDTCGSGVCQATPVLPPGWGTCVGASPEQMPAP